MASLEDLAYQGHAEATGGKQKPCGVLYSAAWIGYSASNSPRIRALRRVEALLAVPQARYWHQGRTSSFLTTAQKDHKRLWSQTHALRGGVRDELQPAHSQTC
eukprot:5021780-Pyramimonas_sp.AAC.2